MSTEQLRRELERIAKDAPGVAVSDDTWPRARRSVLRDRLAAGAAVAAAVAIVAAGVSWLPRHHEPPVADTGAGAIPTRLWTLPGSVALPAGRLAVGPVAAAYMADGGETGKPRFVAVTADDGAYHVLPLSGPDGRAVASSEPGLGFSPFQLSPDGRELAYSISKAGRYGDVAVLDLVDGSVRRVPLDVGRGVLLRSFTWSPDGGWLLWSGQKATSKKSFGPTLSGLVAPGATTTTLLPAEPQDGGPRGYGVGDDGTVAILDVDGIQTWRDGRVVGGHVVDLGSTYSGAALVVEGRVTELRYPWASDTSTGDERTLMARRVKTSCGGRHCGFTLVSGDVPDSLESVSPLGWTSDGALMVESDPPSGSSAEAAIYRLALDDSGRLSAQRLIGMDSQLRLSGLTLASALPVADRPAPSWAPHHRPWAAIGLGVGGTALALGGALWRRRRYREAR